MKRGTLVSTSEKLASGELHPLQINFASERCVFPLKISSLNHTPSEVQVYVLSPEPLVEKKSFEMDLAGNYVWRTNMQARRVESRAHRQALLAGPGRMVQSLRPLDPEPDAQLSSRAEINAEKLIPYAPVGRQEIPVCAGELALLRNKKIWWLMKQTWTFQPEEMRDLEFEPAVPVFSAALADGEGAFAAANLLRLGTNGASALIADMQNTNPAVRAHAMSVAEQMFVAPSGRPRLEQNEEFHQPAMNPDLEKLLPALLSDPDPEVRLHAVTAAWNSGNPTFFNRMLDLLRDDNAEVSEAARGYLKSQRDQLPNHVLLFREMLKDTNANVQIAPSSCC
jgi:hypothetical protein